MSARGYALHSVRPQLSFFLTVVVRRAHRLTRFRARFFSLQGKFTSKTDVWSFAVTLWEVLTFAKIQPYEHLTDEKVIENCGHYYRQDSAEIYLPIPAHAPKEIYDLMRECWNRDEASRPSFREIHMFLQRKNMGYNPKDELMSQGKMVLC